jgi:hypothetical protein
MHWTALLAAAPSAKQAAARPLRRAGRALCTPGRACLGNCPRLSDSRQVGGNDALKLPVIATLSR